MQPIFAVMYGARDGHPEIAELVDLLEEQRLSGATGLAETMAARLGTADADQVTELRDCIWTTMSPTLYEDFVVKRRWSLPRYRAWLRAALQIPLDDAGL